MMYASCAHYMCGPITSVPMQIKNSEISRVTDGPSYFVAAVLLSDLVVDMQVLHFLKAILLSICILRP